MTNQLAIVFPGQGSQSVGMLADIIHQYSEARDVFAEASDVLGYNVWTLIAEGPADRLDQTVHTQPALLASSYAVWRIIQTRSGIQPAMLAGHSLGEYTALVCANAIAFRDAITLVAARGEFMQAAVTDGVGAMAAIVGLDDAAVSDVCKQIANETREVIAPANFNSIGQVVVAGHKKSVEMVIQRAKEQGAKLAIQIPVSVPSHCRLMQPAASRLAELLSTIKVNTPALPVINNVDAAAYQAADDIRDGLARQLVMPVRWVETIQLMSKSGVRQIVECGPGKVLTGLNKRIDKTLQLMTTHDLPNLEAVFAIESKRSA